MTPIALDALRSYFPTSDEVARLVGAEFEVAGYDLKTAQPITYHGDKGVGAVLSRLVDMGWDPTHEDGHIIAARCDLGTLTLEPGGQVELSTLPRTHALELADDVARLRRTLSEASQGLGIAWVGIGLNPIARAEDIEVVPKKRYGVMTDYLKKRGRLALDMMRRTQSVHVTLDYGNEANVAEMARAANLATPIVTGIFAFSPIGEAKSLGVRSYRTEIWRETDPDRCGLDQDAIEGRWSYDRYLKSLLATPLIFVLRDGVFHAANGRTAAEYFASGHGDIEPRIDDLEWVINQTFPDVRVRRYLEMRGADMPPLELAPSIAAFWVGLLYDVDVCKRVITALGHLSYLQVLDLQLAVARDGLAAAGEFPATLVSLAREGLVGRGYGEEALLDPIDEMVAAGESPADRLIAAWHGALAEDPVKLIEHLQVA